MQPWRIEEERVAIGLMSGTSCDGIDAALVRIRNSGEDTRPDLIDFRTFPYEPELRRRLLDPGKDAREVCLLNFLLGERMADAALAMMKSAGDKGIATDFIASHGHTVAHVPPGREQEDIGTLQIGEPAVMAERTGLWVVSDFRPRDMAAGGQGAPLVPYADWLLFRRSRGVTVCLNVGGIANLTVVPPKLEEVIAFDTGPGCMIIDGAARMLSEGALEMDEDGKAAASGRVVAELLAALLDHPYFELPPPKSTGSEMFGPDVYLARALVDQAHHSFQDVMATVTAVVAKSVIQAVDRFVKPAHAPSRLVVSGGGAFNPALIRLLKEGLSNVEVLRSEDLGLRSDAKEAVAFALLGNETLRGRPANVPSATGAGHYAILGKITPP